MFRAENGGERDTVNGFAGLADAARPIRRIAAGTVPTLWDNQTKRIVSNADGDIMDIRDGVRCVRRSDDSISIRPARSEIDALNESIAAAINDGVYKSGFAGAPLRAAVGPLFAESPADARLATRRFLFGPQPVGPTGGCSLHCPF